MPLAGGNTISAKPFAIFPENHPQSLSVVGERITVLASKNTTAKLGTLVHLPAGTVYWFRFKEGGGQMISITGQGSDASQFFTDLDAEIPSGSPDIEKLQTIADRHDVKFFID